MRDERHVTAVQTNAQGYITHVMNDAESWSPRSAVDAILDIELGQCTYYVNGPEGRTQVVDAHEPHGLYLRADSDSTDHNNLLDLPQAS
ncbi:DUF3892 domain-containing protein [Glaciihabitans sp. dw_435]|uniref:DUF3892 domain-containing protein n=1 Tax=Glaciihabitans sp. dw_435 TaxID=2720081 RepID=UPI001BD2D33A|nr:DUF3892 domain-containing protein [Glaciihabitans sp. dw_435]